MWRKDLSDLLHLFSIIWKNVTSTLQQVISQEETPEWVLDATTHLYQVFQYVFARLRKGANIHHTHSDQQIAVEEIKRVT